MGLLQVALFLQLRHLVADGSGAHPQGVLAPKDLLTHRRRSDEMFSHQGFEDVLFPGAEHPLSPISTLKSRVLILV